jgi:ubiquinone/menaquinone biosynthesis C-methylase UbiE
MRGVGHRDDAVMARAVYEASAKDYARQVGTSISARTETADDRGLLLDLVRSARAGPIADLGSGPGRVAAMCQTEGRAAVGVDMTLAMLRVGHEAHPQVRFVAAFLSSLPFAAGSFSAAVLWYSIIHAAPSHLEALFVEVRRIVVPGASALIAFQAGDGDRHERADAHGTGMTMTSWRHDPGFVRAALSASGFEVFAVKVRAPELPHESAAQAFLSARAH